MTGGEKDKQRKRYMTGGEKFRAAGGKWLERWKLDEEGRARFPYQKAPKKQAVYVFIVKSRVDRPRYVGSTHNLWERMRTYTRVKQSPLVTHLFYLCINFCESVVVPLADSRKTSPEFASLLNLLCWQVVERTVNWHHLTQSLVDWRVISICWRRRLFRPGYSNAKFGGSLHEDKINTAVKSKLDAGECVSVYYLTPDPSLVRYGETELKLSVIHGLEQGILQMRAKPEWNKMHGSMRVKET